MASKSRYLGLKLVGITESDGNQTFMNWRSDINGEGEGSNMNIIDTAVGQMNAKMTSLTNQINNVGNEAQESFSQLEQRFAATDQALSRKGENLYFDTNTNLLYMLDENGEMIGDGVAVAAAGGGGGGGGGGGATFIPELRNTLPSRTITASTDSSVVLGFTYTSVDSEGVDDGKGVGTIFVNNVKRKTFDAIQGANTLDITEVMNPGTNNVRMIVENSEGSTRSLAYTVIVVSLSVTTTLNSIDTYSGDADFAYTLIGAGEKTIHYIMDGVELGTETTNSTGRERHYAIAAQTHGSHIFECYATAMADGNLVTSNTIRLSMIWISAGNSDPIIASSYSTTSIVQGDIVAIPYMVYDPASETANVTLSVLNSDGSVYSTQTITKDRSAGDSWIIQEYPTGNITFRIQCRDARRDFNVTVEEYSFPIDKVTDSLMLEFNAVGRSNAEANPAQWSYKNVTATFTGFGWSAADGWQHDEDNAPILRFLPGNFMNIDFKPFAADARETGYTIEVEMATRDVRDYESLVLTCLNGGRGFKIASQNASLISEQSSVSMIFKEDSRIRVSFVVEQKNLNRFIYIYINGIMCGITQYPTNDNFAQATPAGLTIGSNSCGLDLYSIRCYAKGLNRNEQLDNYIVDRSTLHERQAAYRLNDIINSDTGEVDFNKLPATLPYMIVECDELPQYKGDKKTGVTIRFIDPATPTKSFVVYNAEIDVQGTSSAVYPTKNQKQKCKAGFEVNGNHVAKYAIFDGDMPVNVFCIKVNYASCECANNVELVALYDAVCREQGYLTPPQVEDSRVRQGVAGRPIAFFHLNTKTNKVSFVGRGDMNNDKSSEDLFGFTQCPNAESWEYRNNTSDICLFKGANWTATKVDDEGKTYYAWQDDLEARYPEDNTNINNIKRVYDFVLAHDRSTVDSQAAKQAMLDDFKAHFNEYFVRNNMLFYYIFTEVFLMVDSRAKNMFLTTYDGTHWLPLPYDMDTAIGINNEGALAFEYNLEDTDTVDGSIVYNGQSSVLWQNVRDAFRTEIKNMYNTLRSGSLFNYEHVKEAFEAHQSVWPQRMWNEDEFIKYLQPYLLENKNYLDMLQGDKSSQRDWWLYNGFKYRDSKYGTGDAKANRIILRGYVDGDPDNPADADKIAAQMAAANITVTPYAHVYASALFGSYSLSQRLSRNQSYTFVNPMSYMNDTEIYIDSADQLSDVGDLSVMRLGKVADFSAAKKLQQLIVGSSDENYRNAYLQTLTVGNNELLTLVNICNCTALQSSVDLSGCSSLETVLASGSAITGVQLPNGGHLKKLDLPGTITNLTIQNQKNLTNFNVASYNSLETLRIENTPTVPLETIMTTASALHRVRLIGAEWTATSEAKLKSFIDKLDSCIGMDANGNNTAKAVITGRVSISSISASLLERIQISYPELVVVVNGVAQYLVRFVNYDNTLVYNEVVAEGGNAVDPVAAGYVSAPTRESTSDTGYAYAGWGTLPTNVRANVTVVAQYTPAYRVKYVSPDGTVHQNTMVQAGSSVQYNGSTPTRAQTAQYTYTFKDWSGADVASTGKINNVNAPKTVTANYTTTTRTYTVTFKNDDNTTLNTVNNVPYGTTPSYPGSTPVSSDSSKGAFVKWSPDLGPITGDTTYVATYESAVADVAITDDWPTIMSNIATGVYATKYKVGNYKPLDLGTEGTVNMQIVAMDTDTDSAGNTIPITWIAKEQCATTHNMNSSNTTTGGYPASAMKSYMNSTIKALIPAALAKYIKPAMKVSRQKGPSDTDLTTAETVWIPSYREIFGGTSYEQSGPIYSSIYKDSASRIKTRSGSADSWWLRSANSSTAFRYVYNYGGNYGDLASSSYGVVLGFSTGSDTISDSWSEISGAISDGTYKTKYAIGDTKAVDLGDQGVICMQIAAFDADTDANGNTVPITWVSEQILTTTHNMNSSNTTSGGYPASAMKAYINGLKDRLPAVVKSMIVPVQKTSRQKDPSDADLTTTEELWIPSYREVFGGTSCEATGPVYSSLFKDSASRIKKKYGTGSADFWWLRSAGSSTYFRCVLSIGGYYGSDASNSRGVVLGFCTKAAS